MTRADVDPQLMRLITRSVNATLLIIAFAFTASYAQSRISRENGEVKTLSEIYATQATANIAQRPTMWKYEELRLFSLVEHSRRKDTIETVYTIADAKGKTLASSAAQPLPKPVLTYETPLYDATETVGFYRVDRSLTTVFQDTALVGLASLIAAWLFAFPLRRVPVEALRRSQQRLMHMAKHDALTGLPNRSLLDDRLSQALLHAEHAKTSVTVAFLDLDNFKMVNDGIGHDAGDELLIQMAERLSQSVRSTDTVVRLGGDEFVIVLVDHPPGTNSVAMTVQRLVQSASETFQIRGHAVQLGCSIGVASYPLDGADATTLLKNADAAMYRAKELGKNNFQFYTAELNGDLAERFALQDGMRRALSCDEFFLEYQPQVNLTTNEIIGVETLVRWRHPERGIIPPAKFIPLAEDSGLIVALGEWVLRTACLQQVAWRNAGLPVVKLSVNVSPRQFKEPRYAETVDRVLRETRMSAEHLELEITESLIMEDVNRAVKVMNALRALGVQLSIDDFGTGYSSLSSLKNFPVSRLKIDRSFITLLPSEPTDCALAKAVIALGHQLNLKVVAEGVETQVQQQFLQDNNCDEMQGYYYSKAIAADQMATMLAERATGPVTVAGTPVDWSVRSCFSQTSGFMQPEVA